MGLFSLGNNIEPRIIPTIVSAGRVSGTGSCEDTLSFSAAAARVRSPAVTVLESSSSDNCELARLPERELPPLEALSRSFAVGGGASYAVYRSLLLEKDARLVDGDEGSCARSGVVLVLEDNVLYPCRASKKSGSCLDGLKAIYGNFICNPPMPIVSSELFLQAHLFGLKGRRILHNAWSPLVTMPSLAWSANPSNMAP